MLVDQCVSAVSAVEVPVLACLHSSCNHVTSRRPVKFVRLVLQVLMQNGGNFVNLILLYSCWVNKNSFPQSVAFFRCNQTNIRGRTLNPHFLLTYVHYVQVNNVLA